MRIRRAVDELPVEIDTTGGEMHLLEHLEELRRRLITIIIAVAIAAVFGYIISPLTFRLLTIGMPGDMDSGGGEKIVSTPGEFDEKLIEKAMTVLGTDDRERAAGLIGIIEDEMSGSGVVSGGNPQIIVTTPMGPVITKLKLAGITGIIIAIPVIFFEMWKFILPALKVNEKKAILPFTLGSTMFFILGAGFSYSILPILFIFFGNVSSQMMMHQQWIADDYISFIFKLMLAGGTVFQLPVMVYFLTKLGIIGPETLRRYRKHAIVICFVLGAMLTPPDPVSQLVMALPLFLLYEISIWISYFVVKKKRGIA